MLRWSWLKVKGDAESVNEGGGLPLLEFAGSMAQRKAARTWSGCGCAVDVLPRATGNEIVVQWPLLYVCAVSPCGFCVLYCGMG